MTDSSEMQNCIVSWVDSCGWGWMCFNFERFFFQSLVGFTLLPLCMCLTECWAVELLSVERIYEEYSTSTSTSTVIATVAQIECIPIVPKSESITSLSMLLQNDVEQALRFPNQMSYKWLHDTNENNLQKKDFRTPPPANILREKASKNCGAMNLLISFYVDCLTTKQMKQEWDGTNHFHANRTHSDIYSTRLQ